MSNQRILNAILRKSLTSFINKAFCTINPGSTFLPNWHIDLIAEYLEKVRKGEITRLIINMPPRALKSVCVSVAWPAWLLGHEPHKRIIVSSYSQMLSTKHSIDCKNIILADWYQALFPKTRISKTNNLKNKYATTKHGFRFATSVGGSVTGEGGDILIVDDPHNPTYINSKKKREAVIEWFERTFSSRLNNKKTGAIILVMQRLHEDDLAGYLIDKGGWEVLKLPALIQSNTKYQIGDKVLTVQAGSPLHTAREDLDLIKRAEAELGSHNFAAQYLQEPLAKGGNLLKTSDILLYQNLPQEFEFIALSWDTAIKAKASSDYSVCTVWGIKDSKYYLITMLREKLEYPELKNKALFLADKWQPKIILIEDKASGQSLIQDLRRETQHLIKAVKVTQDKVTRFSEVLEIFLNHKVFIPDKVSIKEPILRELTTFPNSKNDDIVDSISQFLHYIKNEKRTPPRMRFL